MACDDKVDCGRRLLLVATAAMSGAAGVAAAVPFVSSMLPSERAKATAAPIEVDIANLADGQMMTVEWRGKPVWILKRSPEMLASLSLSVGMVSDPDSHVPQQPNSCQNATRSLRPEYLVAVGSCTHFGCSPRERFKVGAESGMGADWPGGFVCPCHGATYDLAGRVFKNKVAPSNLEVPPHYYLSDTRLIIGAVAAEA